MSEEKVDLQKLLVFQREFALKEFSDAANVVLDRGAKFNVNDMNYLASRLKKGKKTYLNAHKKGDKKAMSLIMNEMQDSEKQWDNVKDFRSGVAVAAQDQEEGITEDFKVSTQGQEIAAILRGENVPIVNVDGVYGIMMTNPQTGNQSWMSMRNVGGLVKSNSFDKNSKKIIQAMAQNMIDLSSMEGAGEFDRPAIKQKVRTSIVNRGNTRSLTHDKHLPISFYDNLKTAVGAISYKNVGIDKDGNLNDVEQKQIIDNMLADRETHLEYLTNYYTNFLEQNWRVKGSKNSKNQQQPLQGNIVTQPNGRKLWRS